MASPGGRTLGIVIPAYEPDLDLLVAYLEELDAQLAPDRIRVELDAGTPEMEKILTALGADVHRVDQRRGKGQAITDGFDALDTEILLFLDADGSTTVPSVDKLMGPMRGGADVSVGSRRHPDAEIRSEQGSIRGLLGDALVHLARTVLGVDLHDFQCGAKAVTRAAWERIRPHMRVRGFAWDLEFIALASAQGFEIHEVPVVWEDKPGSSVRVVQDTADFLLQLARIRRRVSAIA